MAEHRKGRKIVKSALLTGALTTTESFKDVVQRAIDTYENKGGFETYKYLRETKDRIERKLAELEANSAATDIGWPILYGQDSHSGDGTASEQ
jgi:hypothetical protein